MQVARETYGCAPEVTCTGDLQSTIPYIPTHLDYMLYELLKNAMRCVLELHVLLTSSPDLGVLCCCFDVNHSAVQKKVHVSQAYAVSLGVAFGGSVAVGSAVV